ncbi:MAG: menaquinone biosynthesis protein [Planctomycetota bacterium]|nr:menaquinone biosynthesis protein [Planctomycetota bacterium]
MSKPLRIGSVPYLVGRPLDRGLDQEPGIEYFQDVPARLVERLRSGDLDVALVSSIELFRMPGYTFIPELAVGTRGAVSSVQVFLRRPLDEIEVIAMDPASRTSQALVQILLADRPEGAPKYLFPELEENQRDLPAGGWLSIGDSALRNFHAGTHNVFNPSAAWVRSTGLPFVFAAWIVRPGVDITPYLPLFHGAHDRGIQAIPELAAQAGKTWNLPAALCEDYLSRECVYNLGQDMGTALEAFGERAGALGLTDLAATPCAVQG